MTLCFVNNRVAKRQLHPITEMVKKRILGRGRPYPLSSSIIGICSGYCTIKKQNR